MSLIKFTNKGIYCPRAEVYIDPLKKVDRALITHGHSDHARRGHKRYLCTHASKPILRHRLGKIDCDSIEYHESLNINGVNFSFHPSGHIIGSAQIRAEYKGEIWVVSGDYKVAADGFTEPFEPVKCHHFITESTFGLPIYKWDDPAITANQLNEWWALNQANNKVSIILAYALGKAQRIIHDLDPSIGSIYTDSAVEGINSVIRNHGIPMKATTLITPDIDKKSLVGNIMVATPSIMNADWVDQLIPYDTAAASGWMMLNNTRKRRNVDQAFVISDHADWKGLLSAIQATEAENVYVTHGYTDFFTKYLRESGWNARVVTT